MRQPHVWKSPTTGRTIDMAGYEYQIGFWEQHGADQHRLDLFTGGEEGWKPGAVASMVLMVVDEDGIVDFYEPHIFRN